MMDCPITFEWFCKAGSFFWTHCFYCIWSKPYCIWISIRFKLSNINLLLSIASPTGGLRKGLPLNLSAHKLQVLKLNKPCVFQLNILVDTGSSNFAVASTPHPFITHYFNTSLWVPIAMQTHHTNVMGVFVCVPANWKLHCVSICLG